jgi:ubiquinone/menaquinone biosynthesis C-methylase UbiE
MQRQVAPELIDDPALDVRERERSLRYVRTTNRRFGGVESLLARLRAWSVRWPKDRPVTLLDVGTGSADLPLAARRWAEGAGFDLRITAIDSCGPTLDIARRIVGDAPGITLRRLDAQEMVGVFGARSFDYVHAGLFLHHFDDGAIPPMLGEMDRLAKAGVIWNDLLRTTRGWMVWYLVTMFQPYVVRHDARASYRAGFTGEEVLGLARAAGVDYAQYSFNYNWQRFTLSGERPGAWTTWVSSVPAVAGSSHSTARPVAVP